MALHVLAISGSLRISSLNRKALQQAKKFALEAGAEVEELDLKELNLPMYDGDIEGDIKTGTFPEAAAKLKQALEKADAILIASPEYNFSISGALKNMIDWASRQGNSLNGKWVTLFGVSNGQYGTVRGQPHVRQILQQLGVFMLPTPAVYVANGNEAFNEDGTFVDAKLAERLQTLVTKTIETAGKLKA